MLFSKNAGVRISLKLRLIRFVLGPIISHRSEIGGLKCHQLSLVRTADVVILKTPNIARKRVSQTPMSGGDSHWSTIRNF